MSAASYATGGLRIGDTIGRSYRVLARHFVPFAIVSAISVAPETFLSAATMAPETVDGGDSIQAAVEGLLLVVAGVAFWAVLQTIVQAIILYGTFEDMRGKPVRFGDAIIKGLTRIFPILGLAICNTLAVAAGMVLLLVPGVMLGVATCVASPACVVERLGPFASMKRSIALTSGHRWKIFGILVLVTAASAAGDMLTGTILAAVAESPIVLFGRFLWSAIIGAFSAVVVAVVYHDLRVAREGIDVDRMAAVFD